MTDGQSLLVSISNACVRLHKEQFGRGPTRAKTAWSGDDALLVTLDDALLPSEVELVRQGDGYRVAEQRLYLQRATHDLFVTMMESLVGRPVESFTSACQPETARVFEIFTFVPR